MYIDKSHSGVEYTINISALEKTISSNKAIIKFSSGLIESRINTLYSLCKTIDDNSDYNKKMKKILFELKSIQEEVTKQFKELSV
ncbi:hypothetical protein [Evansella cellulosilytica]|uniref:hypothetical protein n=1 Tax=Evansella cellulosilytica TaxID=1413 RepID=UPI000321DCEE|nr:hypothetical protein [Evansella cellulosilytica]